MGGFQRGKERTMKELLWVSFSKSGWVVGSPLHFHVDARQNLTKAFPEVTVMITTPSTFHV